MLLKPYTREAAKVKIAVVGAGAIGSYLGACLYRGGAEVTLIARGPHLEAMQKNGIKVCSPQGDFDASPMATSDFSAISDCEVVFITLKAYSLVELMPRVAKNLSNDAVVVSGQNGIPWWYFESHGGQFDGLCLESVDPDGIVQRSLGFGRTVGSVIYPATEILEPGVIRHIEGTRLTIGEPDRTVSQRCERISEIFAAGGLKCRVDINLRNQVWLKLLGNASLNPVSALTRASLGKLGEHPEIVNIVRSMMEEISEVGKALGVKLPIGIDRRLERGFAVGDHKTSMLQDIEARKPLEHACMSGAVVELAQILGIPVPYLETVNALTVMLDRGPIPPN